MKKFKFIFLKKEKIKIPQVFERLKDKIELFSVKKDFFDNTGLLNFKKLNTLKKESFSGIITLGGDGTLLKSVPLSYILELPVIPVNRGKFGFLTLLKPQDLEKFFKNFEKGQIYQIPFKPILLSYRNYEIPALNEIAVLKGPAGRIIYLEISLNGEKLTTLFGDGLIVATPVGSTAYNLSAGGPIVHKESPVIICTPICSFKINLKPFVIPEDFEIRIKLKSSEEAHILIDGQINLPYLPQEEITIKIAPKSIRFLSLIPEFPLFNLLKKKFNW